MKSNNTLNASLQITQLELPVYLGWTAAEREHTQLVWLSLTIDFALLPQACQDDELQHTLCYDQLCQHIMRFVQDKEFRLIEFLGKAVFDEVQTHLTKDDGLTLTICKKPPIKNLQQAQFVLSNRGN